MAIPNVTVDEAITAEQMNLIVNRLNAVGNRQVFTSNGTFTVPATTFKISICGGGGGGSNVYYGGGGEGAFMSGARGGDSPMASKVFVNQSVGSSISVTVGGAGGIGANGGPSSVGSLITSNGGAGAVDGAQGADGTHTGTLRHINNLVYSGRRPYGGGGRGATIDLPGIPALSAEGGGPGIVVIEW